MSAFNAASIVLSLFQCMSHSYTLSLSSRNTFPVCEEPKTEQNN